MAKTRAGRGTGPRIVPAPASSEQRRWQDDYHRAMLGYFAEHGQPMANSCEHSEEYGDRGALEWRRPFRDEPGQSPDAVREHVVSCGADLELSSVVQETDWTRWGGTFGDDEYIRGLKVEITCRCGRERRRGFRLEATSAAELINGLMAYEHRS